VSLGVRNCTLCHVSMLCLQCCVELSSATFTQKKTMYVAVCELSQWLNGAHWAANTIFNSAESEHGRNFVEPRHVSCLFQFAFGMLRFGLHDHNMPRIRRYRLVWWDRTVCAIPLLVFTFGDHLSSHVRTCAQPVPHAHCVIF
jgi:hypothetical protein